ncbi:MAG: HupE/UreJ family protein, partial [Alphaproteobacteria bacterium]
MTPISRIWPVLTLAAFIGTAPELALAHAQGHEGESGFWAGFTHPMLGWDHVAAMVAVGLWGAFLGAPAIWLLPVIFPLVMAFGALIGILGFSLPLVEAGIA